jgi:hypothetical protein
LGSPPLVPVVLGLCPRTQLSPYFINWDSYFNSFWEPCVDTVLADIAKWSDPLRPI